MELKQYRDLVEDMLSTHYDYRLDRTESNDTGLAALMNDGLHPYELVNHYAAEHRLPRVDLDDRNAFPQARLSSVDQYRATQRLSLNSLCAARGTAEPATAAPRQDPMVIYSAQEAKNEGAGFWSNRCGWVPLQDATRFTAEEADDWTLPFSAGNDARWLPVSDIHLVADTACA